MRLKLLCVLAHPDDESLGLGGTIARYSQEGVEVRLLCATRGEKGRFGADGERPGPEVVGPARALELEAAAGVLGIRQVRFLGYMDGELDQADPVEATARIARHIRSFRPQVVITFGPEGAYGHPDHIAISQFATGAVQRAAAEDRELPRHAVSKLYYMAWPEAKWKAYQAAFKDLKVHVDGIDRRAAPWPEWALTTVVDTRPFWQTVWKAVQQHRSQMAIYKKLEDLSPENHQSLWGSQEFYRAFSLVNGGRAKESDLFEGLREEPGGRSQEAGRRDRGFETASREA